MRAEEEDDLDTERDGREAEHGLVVQCYGRVEENSLQ